MRKIIIEKKIIWGVGLLFLFLFFGLIFLNLNLQKKMIVESNKESLQILAEEKASQINSFLDYQNEKLDILSLMNAFYEVVKYPNDSIKINIANNRISNLKDIIPGIALFTREGIIIVSENNPSGTDYSMMPIFPITNQMNVTFIRYYDSQRKKDYYGIIKPIYDSVEKNNVVGAIGFDIELDKISNLMKETIESETNEVYLINEEGLLLSDSEYIGNGNKNGVLIQEIKSDGAKKCFEHASNIQENIGQHQEEVFQYINYMGDEVYGAHAYIPLMEGVLLLKKG